MSARQLRAIEIAVIILLAAAPLYVGAFRITLLNYVGVYALAALGLVLLTGIGGMVSMGQAAFVGIAAYATAWATTIGGYSPWIGLVLALVLTALAAAAIGVTDVAPGRAFPGLEHGRLGAVDLLFVRQPDGARPLHRHLRHSAGLDRGVLADVEHPHVLPDLGRRDRHAVSGAQPARFTRGPGDACPARRAIH